MNNYSKLQQSLHRFALLSDFIRKIMFDLEQSFFLQKDHFITDNHVFIAGLARSGTTVLLNALYQSKEFASLTYDDMPFILAPNFWAKISPRKIHSSSIERAHTDGIKVTTESPEAFEEVFWKTFNNDSKNCKEYFVNFILLVLKKNNKTRYLSKNNQNIRRLDLINDYFPNSKILIPFRDPIQQAYSLFFQHQMFVKLQNEDNFIRCYMNLIGHSEFGLDYKTIYPLNLKYPNAIDFNHWLEQWYLTYKPILNLSIKQKKLYLIGYESLCRDPNVWTEIKSLLGIDKDVQFPFKEKLKDINQDIDMKLSHKCYAIYDSLNNCSFGTYNN